MKNLALLCSVVSVASLLSACDNTATPEQNNVQDSVQDANTTDTTTPVTNDNNTKVEEILPDRVLGNADAPTTVIEYASFTCSHCGNFHRNVLPTLKKDYIETGKVKFIYRDFPLDGLALKASQLTRCMPENLYYGFVNLVYERQNKWLDEQEGENRLKNMAALAGMSAEDIDKCLANEPLKNAIIVKRQEGGEKYNVRYTPTIIVNGENKGSIGKVEEMLEALK